MPEATIENALDMARYTAAIRALESKREQALIHDPYAHLLAGERGEALLNCYSRNGEDRVGIALRTAFYDELIPSIIEREEIDTVINLAAGFDSRPYRLALPSTLRWIEADLPEVIAYKSEKLANAQPACQLERQPLDVTDAEALEAFLAQTCSNAHNVLVLTEGLLVYLTEGQVAALAAALHAQECIGWWLAELSSAITLRNQAPAWNGRVAECAHLRFAPLNGSAFFAEYDWTVGEFRFAVAEGLRLNLPLRHKWLLRLLVRLGFGQNQHTDGFVLFKRTSAIASHDDAVLERET